MSIISAKVPHFGALSVQKRAFFLDHLADVLTSKIITHVMYRVTDEAEECLKEQIETLNSDVFGLILETVSQEFEMWGFFDSFEQISSMEPQETTGTL